MRRIFVSLFNWPIGSLPSGHRFSYLLTADHWTAKIGRAALGSTLTDEAISLTAVGIAPRTQDSVIPQLRPFESL